MPFVSITRLRVGSWRYVPGFLIQSLRTALQAKRATGNLAISVLRDADRAFWTRSVWHDEAAMRSFMQSGVHRRIMARLPDALQPPPPSQHFPTDWIEAQRQVFPRSKGRGFFQSRIVASGTS